MSLPQKQNVDAPRDVARLEDMLSEPTDGVIETMAGVEGDVIVLGAGGKMGPTLARMARRASDAAGAKRRVIAVSRFRDATLPARLEAHGIDVVRGDLLDEATIDALPDAAHVVYMAGSKFGTTGNEPRTWAMNTWLPALVCRRYRRSRMVIFSTGNVYPLVDVGGGSVETDSPAPVGEYAMSCLGRERTFQWFSGQREIPQTIIRLNYACELRYGVLVDLAQQVHAGEPVDLSVGHFNVIWQRAANAMALCSLRDASCPPLVLNVTGPEVLRVRDVCEQFARRFQKPAQFRGAEGTRALLSDASLAFAKYGRPEVTAARMIDWIGDWIARGGATLGKPTHFEVTDGRF